MGCPPSEFAFGAHATGAGAMRAPDSALLRAVCAPALQRKAGSA